MAENPERGAVIPLFGLLIVVLIGMAALTIDYGWLYYNQLNAKKAAESAALAGVVHMPLPNCIPPATGTDPNTVAQDVASRNGYTSGVDDVGVAVAQGANCAQLKVTVTDAIEPFFMTVFGFNSMAISRSATAEHLPNLKLGSDDPFLGEDPYTSGRDVDFFLAVNGDRTNKGQGDAFTSEKYGDNDTPHQGGNFEVNQSNPPDVIRGPGYASYYYAFDIPPNHLGASLKVQIFDPQANPGGIADDRDLNNSGTNTQPHSNSRLRFRLFKPDDTPNVWTDNDQLVCGKTFFHEDSSNYHPSWKDSWTKNNNNSFCTTTAIQGVYVLEVRQTGNVDLLNAFSLRALINNSLNNDVAVYGLGSMSLWMFEAGSAATFKAVKLDDVYAGSRLIVQLWDVGDIDGTGSIEFKGSLASYDCEVRERNDRGVVTSNWHADDGGAGCLEVINPEREYNNKWIDFAFDLDGFSCTGDACWSTVQYNLPGKPHDRTTWSAFIDGQPLHLIP